MDSDTEECPDGCSVVYIYDEDKPNGFPLVAEGYKIPRMCCCGVILCSLFVVCVRGNIVHSSIFSFSMADVFWVGGTLKGPRRVYVRHEDRRIWVAPPIGYSNGRINRLTKR